VAAEQIALEAGICRAAAEETGTPLVAGTRALAGQARVLAAAAVLPVSDREAAEASAVVV